MTFDENNPTPRQYAAFVQQCLEKMLGISLPENFRPRFLSHAKRVAGFLDYEDFGAFLLMECQEKKREGQTLDHADLYRIMDAIRHRLVRQTTRHPSDTNTPESRDAEPIPPTLAALKETVEQLAASDLLILNLTLEGGVEFASATTGKSVATIYRRLSAIRDVLKDKPND